MGEEADAIIHDARRDRYAKAHSRIMDAMKARMLATGEVFHLASDIHKGMSDIPSGTFLRVIGESINTITITRERNGHGHHERTYICPHTDILRHWKGVT